jgi:large subunit ribosomal protein L10
MNREQKAEFVDEIRGRFASAPLVILTDFQGATVKEMDQVRRACEPAGIHFRVVKNSLCRRAIAGTPKEKLGPYFKGNVGVLFAGDDPIAAAKVFRELTKTNEKLQVKVGYFDGDVLEGKAVASVADLPSREELLSILLRTMQEAPRQVLGVMQGPARDLLYLLQNHAAELEKREGAAAS